MAASQGHKAKARPHQDHPEVRPSRKAEAARSKAASQSRKAKARPHQDHPEIRPKSKG